MALAAVTFCMHGGGFMVLMQDATQVYKDEMLAQAFQAMATPRRTAIFPM